MALVLLLLKYSNQQSYVLTTVGSQKNSSTQPKSEVKLSKNDVILCSNFNLY